MPPLTLALKGEGKEERRRSEGKEVTENITNDLRTYDLTMTSLAIPADSTPHLHKPITLHRTRLQQIRKTERERGREAWYLNPNRIIITSDIQERL